MSWESLINVIHEAAAYAQDERSRPPEACPNDGEPLREGPDGTLFCRFDGWRYPRDWFPPC